MLRRLFARLLALLRPAKQRPVRSGLHTPIASHTRRFPGRTPALELRRNAGWIAYEANRFDRDRRA